MAAWRWNDSWRMSLQNNRSLLIGGLILLGTGFGCFMAVKDQGGLEFTLFRLERWGRETFHLQKPETAADRKKARNQAAVVTTRLLKRYPSLRIEPKDVRPEENGFLRLYELDGDERLRKFVAAGFYKSLNEKNFDPVVVRAELEPFQEFSEIIEQIAALPDRSSTGMPDNYMGFFPVSGAKYMSDYLLLKARIAAAENDEAEAFRLVELAVNLGNHFREIEQPSFLTETVVILTEMQIRSTVVEDILRDLGVAADLERWRKAITPPDWSLARYSFLMRGEWNCLANDMSYILFLKHGSDGIPDPVATLEIYAARVVNYRTRISELTFKKFASIQPIPVFPSASSLSQEGQVLLFTLDLNDSMWLNGWIRSGVISAEFDAVMDLLIREKNGEDLTVIHETSVNNPLTEMPFSFDPKTRTVSGAYDLDGKKVNDVVLPW